MVETRPLSEELIAAFERQGISGMVTIMRFSVAEHQRNKEVREFLRKKEKLERKTKKRVFEKRAAIRV
ncbi:MAG: hypothetical protein KAR00_02610 [Candidatus Pacebacteria bacterium]|nr:hypothetical protein [Candidatus Paceibacterota bacterium]